MEQQPAKYPQALEEAFYTFNQLSSQLADSYHALETRVANLKEELAHAHDQRYRELTEKERIANRLGALLEALPGGVVVLDHDGYVQEFNPVAADLLGQELKGITWQEVIQRAFSPKHDDGHDISLRDGRRVNISTCPLGTEPGQILLITDVTEVRKLQDSLNRNQRLAAMGEMAASMAHQIRTPLSSATLYASGLKRQKITEYERRYLGEKIISRLRHLEGVVNDMLLYAKGVNPGEDMFMLDEVLSDIGMFMDNQNNSSSLVFAIKNDVHGACLKGNRQMILSALINLIDNASQAVKGEGRIEVSAAYDNDTNITLSVMDNGTGFSNEAKQRAFEPFFTTREEGTGLGLAVVATIISAHGGDISLFSEEGQGSRFEISLPITKSVKAGPVNEQIKLHAGLVR